jgi:hypothetical protein
MATSPNNPSTRRIVILILTLLAAVGGYLLTKYLMSR